MSVNKYRPNLGRITAFIVAPIALVFTVLLFAIIASPSGAGYTMPSPTVTVTVPVVVNEDGPSQSGTVSTPTPVPVATPTHRPAPVAQPAAKPAPVAKPAPAPAQKPVVKPAPKPKPAPAPKPKPAPVIDWSGAMPAPGSLPLCHVADDDGCFYPGRSLGDRCDWVNAPGLVTTWFFNCDDPSLNKVVH